MKGAMANSGLPVANPAPLVDGAGEAAAEADCGERGQNRHASRPAHMTPANTATAVKIILCKLGRGGVDFPVSTVMHLEETGRKNIDLRGGRQREYAAA